MTTQQDPRIRALRELEAGMAATTARIAQRRTRLALEAATKTFAELVARQAPDGELFWPFAALKRAYSDARDADVALNEARLVVEAYE